MALLVAGNWYVRILNWNEKKDIWNEIINLMDGKMEGM
jgi:hypothetical protein